MYKYFKYQENDFMIFMLKLVALQSTLGGSSTGNRERGIRKKLGTGKTKKIPTLSY